MKRFLIVDGSAILFRAFYALPPTMTTKDGIPTNAVYGFLNMYETALEKFAPDYLAVCFDMPGKTFRSEIYEEYKGTRQKTPNELNIQFPIVKEILSARGVKVYESPEYEADDLAASLGLHGEKQGLEVIYLTGDRDYFQLVGENTSVAITRKGIKELEFFDLKHIDEVYGLLPEDFIELKALMGDTSDNIPGVPGIGEKTGIKLIKEYKTLDAIYENIANISGKKLTENLTTYKEQAYMSRKLGLIIRNVDVDFYLEELEDGHQDVNELLKLYERYDLNSFAKKIGSTNDIEKTHMSVKYKVADSIVLPNADNLAVACLFDGYDPMYAQPIAVAVMAEGETPLIYGEKYITDENFYVNLSKKHSISGCDLKDFLTFSRRFANCEYNLSYDSAIAEYLIDPSKSSYAMSYIAEKYFGERLKSVEELIGKRGARTEKHPEFEDVCYVLAASVSLHYEVEKRQKSILEEQDMLELYYSVELPLVNILSDMQYTGVCVNRDELVSQGDAVEDEIAFLTQKIYEIAGEEFNINSTKKLGEILFERLELPIIKKTKTGYSTDVEVLEKLLGQHEIISHIMRYRMLSKLKSTYLDGLQAVINTFTGRIHSNFNQTVTATGRISSTDPNLQNIPVRTDEGRLIRKAFVAKDGACLIDADYSQIELRVLAHITDDANLIETFNQGIDIHTRTASEVFGIPIDEVDSLSRTRAKAVNFGIIYGISDYSLSQDLNIPRKEAKKYIDDYLSHYVNVQKYMQDIVAQAKNDGYVETILHRRRYIPELLSSNFNLRSFGERVALNTPIQGSAADIIKLAMIKVYNALKFGGFKSKLILQIHDELIIETHDDEKDKVYELLKEMMESAVELKVGLYVDAKSGDSWYDTK